jgi:hypothetical protein
MPPELDTFDDGPYSGDEGFDDNVESFEDSEDVSDYENQESFDDEESFSDEGQDSKETSVQAKAGEEIDEDSQVNLLEDQEEKRTEEKEEGSDKKDEESEKSDEDAKLDEPSEDDASKDAGDDAEPVRSLKAFRDGKAYEVPEDAQISVKIKGKSEKVSLSELRDNYSGKTAWEDKFNTLSEEKKTFEGERDQYQAEIQGISKEMNTIREHVESAMKGESHPFDGFKHLLDLMGVNSVQYTKQMQESLFNEYEIFQEMTDAERDAYWLQKENSYLVDKQESAAAKSKASETQREQQAQITQLRETHGISEDDFHSAHQDLIADGRENITAEQVIQAAKLTPLLAVGDEIMSKYEDQLGTDKMNEMARDIAVAMYEDPSFTKEEMQTLIAEELEVETLLSEVTKQKGPEELKYKSTKPREQVYEYESFDDYE